MMRNGTSKRSDQPSKADGGKKNSNYMYSVKPHPNSVKPMGNMYFEKPTYNVRAYGLGEFRVLEDEYIVDIMKLLDEVELCRMSQTSRAFYIFAQLDDVWKEMTLDTFDGSFQFELSWKFTFAKARAGSANRLVIPQPLSVQGFYSDSVFSRWYGSHIDLWKWGQADNIERRSELSLEDFVKDFGLPNKPCIITDIVPKWPAFKSWTKEQLLADFGEIPFKTDNGVSLKLDDYMTYCDRIHETIPIYVFDNEFGEKCPRLLTDYIIPSYFSEDFFNVLGPKDRPSFRWILIGPPRSGSSFHKDPNSTSAWNGLMSGAKKWIFLPPEVTPPGVFPSDDGWEVSTPEAVVEWFIDFYGEIKKYNPIECVQRPGNHGNMCKGDKCVGELVFVPSGWWHAALNLEESIAVTQNVVNSSNLHRVIKFLASKKNQELYEAFMSNMRERYPQVLDSALERMKEDKPKETFWEKVLKPKEESDTGFSFSFGFEMSE